MTHPNLTSVFKDTKDTFHYKNKFLGAYIPRELVDHISLYTLYQKNSKTKTVIEIVQKFLESAPTERELLQSICESCHMSWIESLEKHKKNKTWKIHLLEARWKEYRKELEIVLRKRLPEYYVSQIIKYIEEAQF